MQFGAPSHEGSRSVPRILRDNPVLSPGRELGSVDEKFGLGCVIALLEGAAQMEGGDFGKLLVAQILLFFLPQFG